MQTLFNIGTPDFKGSTTCLSRQKMNYFSLWKMNKSPPCSQLKSILNSRTETIHTSKGTYLFWEFIMKRRWW